MPKITYYKEGSNEPQTGDLSREDQVRARTLGLTLTEYMNRKYPNHNRTYGSVIHQASNTNGIYLQDNPEMGIRSSTVAEALNTTGVHTLGATFDGTAQGTPMAAPTQNNSSEQGLINRILFGENILQMVESHFRDRRDDAISNAMSRMVAFSQSFPDAVFVQPIIHSRGAEDVEGLWAASTQDTKPPSMLSIALSTESKRIPSYSVGLELTYEAMRRINMDMLGMVIAAHSRGLRIEMMYKDLVRILQGNPLIAGEAPLPTFTATSLDPVIANVPGLLTQKAWYDFLFDDQGINVYDLLICDKSAYRSIIERTGRRVLPNPAYEINKFEPSDPSVINLADTNQPAVLILPDGIYPVGTILGIDTSLAIAEAIDSSASYMGTESDDITRKTEWRWDWSRLLYRLTAQLGNSVPFKVMTLT